jgi:hypothetical protein
VSAISTPSRAEAARPEGAPERPSGRTWLPWLALAAIVVLAGAEIMYLGRGLTWHHDEWSFVMFRQGHALDVFLQPHNEHVSVVPVVIFKTFFKVFGIDAYGPYRLLNVLIVEACAVLVYLYARPRLGAWYALVPAVLVGFMGMAAEDLFWPFELSLELPVACTVAALLLIDRGGRAADAAVSALTTVAVFCSGVGLVMLAGVALEVFARADRWRRAWIVGVPALLYVAWWIPYHKGSDVIANAPFAPRFVANSLAASTGGLVGLNGDWGQLLAVALVVAVAFAFLRATRAPVRLITLCALPLAYWISIALVRGADANPDQSRYLFVGGTFVVLLIVELLRGRRLPASRAAAAVTVGLTAVVCLASLQLMREMQPFFREKTRLLKAEIGAVELARDTLPPDQQLDQNFMPGGTVALYLRARDAYGSPAPSESELAAGAPDARQRVDFFLVKGAAPTLEQARDPFPVQGPPPAQAAAQGAELRPSGSCLQVSPSVPNAKVDLIAPGAGLIVRPADGAVGVAIRRFADEWTAVGEVGSPQQGRLRMKPDRAQRPWIAQLTGSEPFSACTARP